MEVERWLDAVQEMLSNDATGLSKRENLQEELNNCKVRQPENKLIRSLQYVLLLYRSQFRFVPLNLNSLFI